MTNLLSHGLDLISLTAVFWAPIVLLSALSTYFTRVLGHHLTLCLGMIGVPIHELSHLTMVKLLGCFTKYEVTRVNFFNPKYDGTLGFVEYRHAVTWASPFLNMLIGLAPLLGGMSAFFIVTTWLRPDLGVEFLHDGFNSSPGLLNKITFIIRSITDQGGFLNSVGWFLMSFSILLFSCPSKADLVGCRAGVAILIGWLIACMSLWPGAVFAFLELVIPYLSFFGSMLVFSMVFMSCFVLLTLTVRYVAT